MRNRKNYYYKKYGVLITIPVSVSIHQNFEALFEEAHNSQRYQGSHSDRGAGNAVYEHHTCWGRGKGMSSGHQRSEQVSVCKICPRFAESVSTYINHTRRARRRRSRGIGDKCTLSEARMVALRLCFMP
jgi:hypothetical protein